MRKRNYGPIVPLTNGEDPTTTAQDHWAVPGIAAPLTAKEKQRIAMLADPEGRNLAEIGDGDRSTSGLALAAAGAVGGAAIIDLVLFLGMFGVFLKMPQAMFWAVYAMFWVVFATGIVCGHASLRSIRAAGGARPGGGIATASLLVGYAWLLIVALQLIIVIGGAAGWLPVELSWNTPES